MKVKKIASYKCFFFDFDGVLTNNKVITNNLGNEYVVCNRSDGLYFNILKKFTKHIYIISTEKNRVVSTRSKKLKIPAYQGIKNKLQLINEISKKNKFNLEECVYIGNDINDYLAMQECGLAICPADSHKIIKKISLVLKRKGGEAIVSEIIEDIFKINIKQYI